MTAAEHLSSPLVGPLMSQEEEEKQEEAGLDIDLKDGSVEDAPDREVTVWYAEGKRKVPYAGKVVGVRRASLQVPRLEVAMCRALGECPTLTLTLALGSAAHGGIGSATRCSFTV